MKKLAVMTLAMVALSATAFAEDVKDGKAKGELRKGGMFERLDTDGDGSISKDEFLKVHEERFNKIDTNGDGVISAEEHAAAKAKMSEKMKEHRGKRKHRGEKDEAPAVTE